MCPQGRSPGWAEIIPATNRALTRSRLTARSRPSQRPVLPAFAHCPPFHKRSSPALASPHPDLVLSSLLTHTENKKLASCTCAGKGVMPRDTPVLERRDCRSVRQGEAIAGRRVDRLPEHARIQSQPPTQDQAAKCADVTRALRGPWRASAQVWLGRFGLAGLAWQVWPAGMPLVRLAELGHHHGMTSNEERVASMQARQLDLCVVRR